MKDDRLKPFGNEIWIVERPFSFLGVPLGQRMTVIRLPDQKLLIHSAVPCDDETETAIRALGEISYLVVPNCEHTRYVEMWKNNYPRTALIAPSKSGLQHDAPLEDSDRLPWPHEAIETVVVEGIPRLQEVAFFHHLSRTLILTDLAFNLRGDMSLWARTFLRLNGAYNRFTPSRLLRSWIKDEKAFRDSIAQIIRWDFEKIIIAHGTPITDNARERFGEAFRNV